MYCGACTNTSMSEITSAWINNIKMSTCVLLYVHIYTYAFISEHTFKYLKILAHILLHTYKVCTYTCVHVNEHMNIHVNMRSYEWAIYNCIFVFAYLCMLAFMYLLYLFICMHFCVPVPYLKAYIFIVYFCWAQFVQNQTWTFTFTKALTLINWHWHWHCPELTLIKAK